MSQMPNELTAETIAVNGATVVRVRGQVDFQTSPAFRALLTDYARREQGTVRIDLSEVPHMDSSGVGTIVHLKRDLERSGRRLILIGLQRRVRGVFEITNLDRFFTIVPSLDEAFGE